MAQGNWWDAHPLAQGGAPQPVIPLAPIQQAQQQAALSGTQLNNNRTAVQTQGDALQNVRTGQQVAQNPISPDDAKIIQAMRDQLGDMSSVLDDLRNAANVVDRFHPGPSRAATVNSAVTPPEAKWGDSLVPKAMKWWNGVSDQDISDYQTLMRYRNAQVLQAQKEQKGPQTESDAIRMAMTGISPDKNASVNAKIISDQIFRGMLAQQKPAFWVNWATKHGSINAVSNGQTVDQAWNALVNSRTRKYNSDPRISRLSKPGNAPGGNAVIRYDNKGNRIQ